MRAFTVSERHYLCPVRRYVESRLNNCARKRHLPVAEASGTRSQPALAGAIRVRNEGRVALSHKAEAARTLNTPTHWGRPGGQSKSPLIPGKYAEESEQ